MDIGTIPAVLIGLAVFGLVGFAIYKTIKKKTTGTGQSGSEALGSLADQAKDEINKRL